MLEFVERCDTAVLTSLSVLSTEVISWEGEGDGDGIWCEVSLWTLREFIAWVITLSCFSSFYSIDFCYSSLRRTSVDWGFD